MAEKGTQHPATGSDKDISKAQSLQQPPNQASQQQPDSGQQGQREFAQDEEPITVGGLQDETLVGQRTDIDGASLQSPEEREAESTFVGAKGRQDTSSELVEDEESERDGLGTAEDK